MCKNALQNLLIVGGNVKIKVETLDGAKLALPCSDRVGNQCGLGFPGPAKLSFALQFLHHDVSLFLLTSFCVSQRRLENISQRKLEMSHKEKCRHVRTRP